MNDKEKDQERSPLLRIPPETVEAVQDSDRVIARSRHALRPVLEHAENVRRFDAAVREARVAIKKAYESAGLDYQLARHAIWISDTVSEHREEHPAIENFGPSLVLLVREAERRFRKEDRCEELPGLIGDIADGTPRRLVRQKYMPPKPKRGPAAVVAAVRAGRMERARRAFEDCTEAERKKLVVLARGLSLIVGHERAGPQERGPTAQAGPEGTADEAAEPAVVAPDIRSALEQAVGRTS